MANEFKVKKGLIVEGSGSVVLDIQGSQGQLFSITDDLTGDLFSVSDISGVPILNVNADGTTTFDGNVILTGPETLDSTSDTSIKFLTRDSNGVVKYHTLGSNAFNSNTYNNYSLPLGSSSTRGGFKIGYTESGKNYPVEISSEKMYVNVPWTDNNTQLSQADVRKMFSGNAINTSTGVITDTNTFRSIHDTPVDGATTTSISSNWAFDNVKKAVPSNALFTDTNTNTQLTTAQVRGKFSGNGINTSTGVITDTNTQLSSAEVRGKFSAGTNVSISSTGVISSTDTNTDTNTQLSDEDIAKLGYIKTYTDTNTQLSTADVRGKFSGNAINTSTGVITNTNTHRAISSTPTNGATTTSISSDWAFDNVKTAVPSGAVFTDTNTNTQLTDAQVRSKFSAGTNVAITAAGVISSTDTNTNTQLSTADVRGKFSGNAINTSTGVITNTNTQLSAAQVRANFSAGTNVSISAAGVISSTDTNTDTNTQLTTAQVRGKISGTGLIGYNSSTGVISTTATNVTNNNQLTNGAGYQTSTQVNAAIEKVVDSAPAALDTLNEIAASLGDDDDFAGSMTTALAGKLSSSGKAADSNLLDGLDLHTGRNNVANRVVRTNASGYADFGWINTTSGTAGTINRIYCSQDDYIRYLSPQNFRNQIISAGTNVSISSTGVISSTDTNTDTNTQLSDEDIAKLGYIKTYTDTNTTYSAGSLLDLSGTAFNVDLSELTDMTAGISTSVDEIVLLDNGAQRRKRFSEIFGSNAYNSTTIPTNNNQLTNGSGFTTNTGTTTPSNTQTFTNKSGNISQWTNNSGFTTNTGTVTSVSVGAGLDISNNTTTPTISLDLTEITLGAGLDSTATGLSLDLSEFTDMTAAVSPTVDEIILLDNGAERKKRFSEIFGSNAYNSTTIPTNNNQLTNGAGYITSYTDTNTWRAIHDTPVNAATTTSISSNWAFDNVKKAVPSNALFTDTNTQLSDEDIAKLGYIKTYTDTNSQLTTAQVRGKFSGTGINTSTGVITNTNTQLSAAQVRANFSAGTNVSISGTGVISSTDTNTDTNTQRTDTEIIDVIEKNVNPVVSATVSNDTTTFTKQDGTTFTLTTSDSNTWRGIHDTPVNGATTTSISSNWAFDNVKKAVPSNALFTDTNTNTQLSAAQVRANFSAGTNVSISSAGVISSTDTNTDTNTQLSTAQVRAKFSGSGINTSTGVITNTDTNTQLSDEDIAKLGYIKTYTDTDTRYSADGNYGLTLSGTTFRLEDDRRRNSTSVDIYTGNTHDYVFFDASHGMRFYTAGSEDMRLDNSGNLHVDGDIIAYSSTISDKRLKDNVTTIENPLDKIKALRGVEYDWNNGSKKGKHDLGLIAQEVEEVIPEIISEHTLPFVEGDDDTLYKTVDYEKMVAVLIEGMKEQQTQIDSLKTEIEILKGTK